MARNDFTLDMNNKENRLFFIHHVWPWNMGEVYNKTPKKLIKKFPMRNFYMDEVGDVYSYELFNGRMIWVYQYQTESE